MIYTLAFGLTLVTLTACGPKQTVGTFAGAGAGALIGANVGKGKGRLAAVAIGTLVGAAAGGWIGGKLDEQDRQKAETTMNTALESAPDNQGVAWSNPNNNTGGATTVTKTEVTPSGQPCREFYQDVFIGGEKQKVYGKACRLKDGSWQIIQ